MSTRVLNNLDLSLNQLLNIVIQVLASDPGGTPPEGQFWYNSTTKQLKYYDGNAIQALGVSGGISNVVEDTTPQLGGMLDVNGFTIGDGTRTLIGFVEDGAAVNFVEVENEATGAGPILRAAGTDTNVDLRLLGKGTGNVLANGTRVLTTADEGAGNGIDADTLDGQEGAHYLARANHTGTQAVATLSDHDKAAHDALSIDADTVDGAHAAGLRDRSTHTGTQAASTISDFDTQVRTNRLDQMAAPTATVSFNGQTISSVADPTAAQDAATKAYVDAARSGLDVKDSVRAASTGDLTLSGTQTVDGVSLIANDRVLVKNQSTGSENGIYTVAAGAWSRATDFDSNAEVNAGAFTFVEEGTAAADSGWVLTTDNPIVVGTTALSFTQFSGAGQITAGDGLVKSGNTIDAVGTAGRIAVAADAIDIDSGYVGQASITTVGTITSGTWNGTDVAVADGGTGASTAAGAKTNLGFLTRHAEDVGDGAATSYAVTHNLGTRDVTVQVYDNTGFDDVIVDTVRTNTNTVTVTFASAPASNAYRVVVVG